MVGSARWGAGTQQEQVLSPGSRVGVRLSRGRLATRPARVLDIHAAGSTGGTIVAVRWDDDGSVSYLVPGPDVEVAGS